MTKKYKLPKQTLWNFISRPLDSLWLYFHLYNGASFKYAEQAIDFIDLLRNLQYKADRFLGAIFGFIFDVGEVVIPWIGRAVFWLIKATLTVAAIAVAGYLLWETATNMSAISLYFELRWWEAKLVYAGTLVVLSVFVSVVQVEIWNLRNTFLSLVPINTLLLTLVTIMVGFGLYLATPH